jgi:hypothetical protein
MSGIIANEEDGGLPSIKIGNRSYHSIGKPISSQLLLEKIEKIIR